MLKFSAFLAILLTNVLAFAQAPDYSIHQDYISTRALGMGNAFIAVADDHNGLFYNPASLALRKKGRIHTFLRGGIDADYLTFADDLDAADGDATATGAVLDQYAGDHLYARAPTLGAVWVRPRWGIGFIPVDLSTEITPNRTAGTTLSVNAYLDTTLAYGYGRFVNWGKLKKQLAIGGTIKAIHRAYYSDVITAGSLATGDEVFDLNKAAEGMTIDLDIGALYIPKIKSKWMKKYFKPSFAAVLRNVGDYGFPMQFEVFNDENPSEPPDLQRRLDLGAKFDLYKLWVFDPKFAVDIKDIGHDNWNELKGFHAGVELFWKMYNWWKGHWSVGVNQGYWTAGFGAKLGFFQLELASWGEEMGAGSEREESRRYILEMSLDF